MPSSYVGVRLRGGLGNRLFMLAAAFGQAESSGRTCCISGVEHNAHSDQRYEDTLFAAFERRTVDPFKPGVCHWIEPSNRCLCYDASLAGVPPETSVFMSGYFQNEKYLEGRKDAFVRLLRLPTQDVVRGAMFVHVRRGDYVGHAMHAVNLSLYFGRALALARATFGDRLRRILLFSDDPAWMESNKDAFCVGFLGEVVRESDETVALARMAACELGGVCANSSFSWWGAYLGFAPGKLVTFPDTWFNCPPSPDAGAGAYADDIAFAGSVRVRVY